MRKSTLFKRGLALGTLSLCGWSCQSQTLSEVVQQALAQYPAIAAANAKTDAARSEIGRARSQHYPQVTMGVGRNSYSSGQLPASMTSNSFTPAAKINLWSGGRIEAEAERAEALAQSSASQALQTQDDVALQATEAYLGWVRQTDLSALSERNLQVHLDILEDIRKIAEVDTGRRIDLQQAQVRVDNARLALEMRQAELAQMAQKLRRFWSGPLQTAASLSEQAFQGGQLHQMPASLNEALLHINDDFPGVANYKAQVTAAEAAVRQAKALYWPTVDVTSSRAFNGNTLRFETLTQLQVNMQVFNGQATAAQVETATAQLMSAQASLDEARLIMKEKVGLAWQEWVTSRSRAQLGLAQSSMGEKVVEGYRQQFRLARRSLLDLLNVQADTFNYQTAARSAYHDERIARARLLAAMADLARRFSPGPVAPQSAAATP